MVIKKKRDLFDVNVINLFKQCFYISLWAWKEIYLAQVDELEINWNVGNFAYV